MTISNPRNINLNEFAKLPNSEAKLKFLLRFAILAPSSHNTQPWLFKIKKDILTVEIYANHKRRLSASDATDRQLYLSLGAAIGNLLLAAEGFGLRFEIKKFNEQIWQRPVAEVNFKNLAIGETFDEKILLAILSRHNNRNPFEDTTLPSEFIEKIGELCRQMNIRLELVTDKETKNKIKKVVEDAIVVAFRNAGFTSELANWFRPSLKKYRDGMAGYNLGVPWLLSFIFPWILRKKDVSESQKKIHKIQLQFSPAYGILSSQKDDIPNWLIVGEVLERIAVEAEKRQIRIGLLAAPIEMPGCPETLQDILGLKERPLVFFRAGYTNQVPVPSPRLHLEEILI